MHSPAPQPTLDESGLFGPVLGDVEFDFIRHVVSENAGIVLGPNKRHLVQGRLASRLRELDLLSFTAYCNHLRESGPEELVGLINAITTNVTSFFRENHHFDALASYMLPEAMQRNAATKRLRIWSAGCSTGEEPYCIAMIAAECVPTALWNVKILATDIDSEVIAAAQPGVYPLDRVAAIPPGRLRRSFHKGIGPQAGKAIVKPEIRELVTFRVLNLLHGWPMRGPFDIIFCRNVMIYFDQATRESLVGRFAQMLAPGGYLCIGHSESIHHPRAPVSLVGRTIYRRDGESV